MDISDANFLGGLRVTNPLVVGPVLKMKTDFRGYETRMKSGISKVC